MRADAEAFAWTDSWGKQSAHKDLIDPDADGLKLEWSSEWQVVKDASTDKEGWAFASQFGSKSWTSNKGLFDVVRRRRWLRQCKTKSE